MGQFSNNLIKVLSAKIINTSINEFEKKTLVNHVGTLQWTNMLNDGKVFVDGV